jgi:hypothetical protein
MLSGFGVITIEVDNVAVCTVLLLSFTITPSAKVPLTVGVPLITPVEEVRFKPAGKLPEVIDQMYGCVPPVADRVWE